jgi:hypothetical protein
MPARQPTPEQQAAVDAFRGDEYLVLQAGAGTGKTTTLTLLGASTRDRGRYLAFNKAIAVEASSKFSPNVVCSTAHKLAFKSVGYRYLERLNHPRMATAKLASSLGITMEVTIGEKKLTTSALCYAARRTVALYCYSADEILGREHVPWLKGIGEEHLHDQLAHLVLPYAQRMWADLQNPERGRVPFKHDHYLKMWALTRPRILGDFLLLDEAQDTNPVLEQVFLAQGAHAQLVMVGDSAQAIYGWRGARDVMTGFRGRQLALSHSFRFGAGLATEANRWLAIADAPIRLTGSPTVTSSVETVEQPDPILCRTNGGAMAEILTLLAAGRRVALAGRAASLKRLAEAARDLQAGRRTIHPELLLFSTWGEVQDYAEWDPDGRDLLPFVEVIDDHGVDVVLATLSRLTAETHAEVVVSTPTPPKAANGPPSASPTTSPNPKTPRTPPSTATRCPGRSSPPKPASPTSPSPARSTASTSAASPGSTATPTAIPTSATVCSGREAGSERTVHAQGRKVQRFPTLTFRLRSTAHHRGLSRAVLSILAGAPAGTDTTAAASAPARSTGGGIPERRPSRPRYSWSSDVGARGGGRPVVRGHHAEGACVPGAATAPRWSLPEAAASAAMRSAAGEAAWP